MDTNGLTVDELIEKATNSEENGDLEITLNYWRAIVEKEPIAEYWIQLGRIAFEVGEGSEAEDAFLSALDKDPEIDFAYDYLGRIYLNLAEYEIAESYYKQSLEHGENARRFTLLGVSRLRQDMVILARESFSRALEIDPTYEEAYYNLAITYRYDQTSKAIELLNKALEIDENYAVAHREMGWCLRQLGNFQDALSHLNRAIELSPSDGWSYVYHGNTLWATEDVVSAESAFNKVIEIWPDDSLGYWCLALFLEYMGRDKESEELYQKGYDLDPDDIETNLRFGVFLKEIGQKEKAKYHLERVLKVDASNKKALQELSTL